MKKGKHSNVVKDDMIDIYSNSKGPRRKLNVFFLVLFIIESVIMIGSIIYIATMRLFPLMYIIILAVAYILICLLQLLLTSRKKMKALTRTISIILAILMIAPTIYGILMLGVAHTSVKDVTDDDFEVAPNTANVTKEPFIIYVSGSDTRNVSDIPDEGLSDVNMIIAVNPKEHKMLMINTPRDYYVALYGDTNKMDKLTHAGNKGIECSMQTLEALYDIKFNYYVKINFKSVVDIVDALGGVTVDSEIAFSSSYSLSEKRYYFNQGPNELSGDAALAFVRERKSLASGDRQRGKNQQLVISAIVDKAISPSILNPKNFKKLLKSVTDNTKMNISQSEITALFRMQLSDMSGWDIQSLSVDGRGSSMYTYSYPSQPLYVMIPDEETLNEAKTALAAYKK